MSFKRECSVITLPTREADENCLLFANNNGLMSKNTHKNYFTQSYLTNELRMSSHHLYVLLHDESKIGSYWEKGTWFLDMFNVARQAGDRTIVSPNDKQIIATTDKEVNYIDNDLSKSMGGEVKRRTPRPTDAFIDKFIESFNSKKPVTKVSVDFIKFKRCVKCKAPYLIHICTCGEQDNFEYYEHLKIGRDNTITITKAKDNWNRDEVFDLLYDALTSDGKGAYNMGWEHQHAIDWINEKI